MRRRKMLAMLLCLLLAALGPCGAAAEESAWQTLCGQHGLEGTDVIAWLEIPGYPLCLPVMQHPADDAFYASHAPDGSGNAYGSVYVQAKYNAPDFSDPVTLLYGSSASEDAPFGRLQEQYSGSFDGCRMIFLHTRDATQAYLVFAALPYSSVHILHYYNFRNARRYTGFFDSVFSTRALGMHLDRDGRPVAGTDQVIILSTGLRGDPLQRYLVMAKKISQ